MVTRALTVAQMVLGMKQVVICVKWVSIAAMVICFLWGLPRIIRALRGEADHKRNQ